MRCALFVCSFVGAVILVSLSADAVPTEISLVAPVPRANSLFGQDLVLRGDTLVVGAKRAGPDSATPGLAYVFERDASTWTEKATLSRQGAVSGDEAGAALDLRGDVIAMGCRRVGSDHGAVQVYRRSLGEWIPDERAFNAGETGADDLFGTAVVIDDAQTILAGASARDDDAEDAGAVYVCEWTGDSWEDTQKLNASDPMRSAYFGYALALDGDSLAVSAPSSTREGKFAGAVYVFDRNGGDWTQSQKLVAWGPVVWSASFGVSVAIEGDTLVVGAPKEVVGQENNGAVFVFERSDGHWAQKQKLVSPQPRVFGYFGISVSLSGDLLVVGEDDDLNQTSGKAYVFAREGGVWAASETLTPSDAAAGYRFGIGTSLDGTTAAIGADGVADYAGAVYVFEGLDTPGPPPADPVDAFLVPATVFFEPPVAGKSRPAGTLVAKGSADVGVDPLDLTAPGVLVVGARTFDVPGLAEERGGKMFRHVGDDAAVEFRPAGTASSRAKFEFSVSGLLPGEVPADGELDLRYSVGGRDLESRVRLVEGVFKLKKQPHALVEPSLCPLKVKGRVKGGGRDTLKVTAVFANEGVVPDPLPPITVGIGAFEATVPAADLRRKRDKLIFKGDVGGLRKVVIDYARSRISLVLRKADLGALAEGPVPLQLRIALGHDARAAQIFAVRKGKSLKY